MIVVLFRSKLTSAAGDDYTAMDAEMMQLIQQNPGFVDVKSYKAEDGERLTIVRFKDEETLKAWGAQERHRVAQSTGREKWYEYYKLETAKIIRTSEFEREA